MIQEFSVDDRAVTTPAGTITNGYDKKREERRKLKEMKTLKVTIFACNKNDYTTSDLTHPLKYKTYCPIVYPYFELVQVT